ncbi:MBL fold metallo-hydrolase [Marinactinospora thermotolerans]|uniref:Glyoxylase, beta-lactamase superfamily II n=1 Tax=Marinactinospora thermotolerans DSM 45154 TaxID=1122192 RepID=A0A1T4R9P2_9ACTN|nr:MBL fold metallo-hydrolase [Marinactinospora thermotolerans]SKA12673.1 Glyoxylase, beta-lactamase superfamily II [Marinactinospora thermotolerans DSM 45154]
MRAGDVVQVAEGVHFATGSNTNWVILVEGADLTLIDAGYPGDADAVEASIRSIGHRPEAVRAILVTHAHVDHIGSIPRFLARYDVPVYMDAREVPHARRAYLEQVTPAQILANAWRPGVLPWAVHAVRTGGLTHVEVPQARAFPSAGALDLPGRPVPVPTPGHTSGHCAYHLPAVGALVTGDTLVSAHPTSRLRGGQCLPAMFNHDGPGTVRALEELEGLAADLLLPGHGPAVRGPVRDRVAEARANAARRRP